MKRMAVIVPYKAAGQKSRLEGLLTEGQRRSFSLSMLMDLLHVLKSATGISDCFVVTADKEGASVASTAGANVVLEPRDNGVNSAVRTGMDAAGPGSDFMVLPSDIPTLKAKEVREMLCLYGSGLDVVIAPSRKFDGTNALLFPEMGRLELSYDRDSFWSHVGGAAAAGYRLGVYDGVGAMFDIDSTEDFRELARRQGPGETFVFIRGIMKK